MGSRVLLADDSVTIQKVVGIIFANEGYELTIVDSGDAALAKAREIKPDVMLIDALMPGKTGYEVCSEVRQDPALAHTAILLMTGAFEAVDEERNRQSGADDFITKPFESQALIDVTNRLIALTSERASAPSAAIAPAAVPPPVAAATAVATPQVDDIWATGFEDEPVASAVPAPEADMFSTPSQAAVVKASADDDLWGAFEMDSAEEAPASAPAAVTTSAEVSDDIFAFDSTTQFATAEDEFVLEDVVEEPASAPVFATTPTSTGFEPVDEQEIHFGDVAEQLSAATAAPVATSTAEIDFSAISFDEEPPAPVVTTAPVVASTAEVDFSAISFDEEPSVSAVATAPAPEDFSSISFDEEPASVTVFSPPEPVPSAAPVIVAAAVTAAPAAAFAAEKPAAEPDHVIPPAAAAAAIATFDESQVKELLASLSRDVIEKIVWEVVPDLAEMLIKEEIRKLKAGIA